MELFMFFIPIPIPGYIFVIGYMVYTLYGMKSQSDSIGHVTHFGGAISGILLTLFIMPQLLIESSWIIIILLSTIIISGYYLFKLKK
jgi:membrane associated rhomboid family serine protease